MSEIIRNKNKIIIKPVKDIVASTIGELEKELEVLIQEAPKEIEIDMYGIKMIDSIGIGILIATHNTIGKNGGILIVTNVSSDIYKVFSVMRLNHHFKIEKALE